MPYKIPNSTLRCKSTINKEEDYNINMEINNVRKDQLVMPGDHLTEIEKRAKTKKVILGPGIRQGENVILATKAGILKVKEPNVFWIDSYQKRYIPARGESVIGIVVSKAGDIFRVDIGAYEYASLSYLAFEGATKKNRPDINSGDVVYGKLNVASRDFEPELVCVNSLGKKDKFGVLANGFVFGCSINLVRKILHTSCPLLHCLKKEMPYEIGVGMNGRIWIKAKSVRETIALGNAILAAEYTKNEDIPKMCEEIGNILFL